MRKKAVLQETTVKSAPVFEVVLCYVNDGYRVMLKQKSGRKWIHGVVLDCPIQVVKLPIQDEKYMSSLDYTPESTAKHFLNSAKRLGITQSAKKLLKLAK